jgi:uncharacterized membrane protein YczE
MLAPPVIRGGTATRSLSLLAGVFLFAVGIVTLLEADLGLAPWDVLNQGISDNTPLSFGAANIVVAVGVLAAARLLGAQIGPGTVANAVLIGLFVDLLLRAGMLDGLADEPLLARSAALVAGILVIGVGSGFYIGAGMGAGPRDSLMLVSSSRTGVRIGLVRAALEVAVTGLGFVLGGTVGIGTLAFAFGIGPAVELSFKALERVHLAVPGAVGSSAP